VHAINIKLCCKEQQKVAPQFFEGRNILQLGYRQIKKITKWIHGRIHTTIFNSNVKPYEYWESEG
jgi:hypothetical protein